MSETIKFNWESVSIGTAIQRWEEAGICRDCINYRIETNKTYEDAYSNFAKLHCSDCTCN